LWQDEYRRTKGEMAKISEAQRALNYAALLDATAALMADRGYEAVSMRDIAEHAGLARTAIYNYATDKAELLIAATGRSSLRMRAAIIEAANDSANPAPERLDAVLGLILGSFSHDTRNLMLLRSLHRSVTLEQRKRAVAPFRDDVSLQIAHIVQDGIENGDFEPAHDLAFLLELLAGALTVAVEAVQVVASTRRFVHNAIGRTVAHGQPEFSRRQLPEPCVSDT
jgi:AcrR family transcriptional regulator